MCSLAPRLLGILWVLYVMCRAIICELWGQTRLLGAFLGAYLAEGVWGFRVDPVTDIMLLDSLFTYGMGYLE